MEAIKRNERYEYVQIKPKPILPKKWADMDEVSRAAWEKYICIWFWRAAESLVELRDFNPSLKFISSRLGISLADAVDAMEGLEIIGAIKRLPEGGWSRTGKTTQLPLMEIPGTVLQKGQLYVSCELNSRILDTENISVGNFIFSATRNQMKVFLNTLEKIVNEAATSPEKTSEEVFGFSFAMTSLSPPKSNREAQR